MAFYSEIELQNIGFKKLGKNVKISNLSSIYNVSKISIGDNSRIDDFCILSGGEEGIEIGRYVHIACYCSLIGKKLIRMNDFSGLSSRVSIYSSSDDYSGRSLTNPTVDSKYTRVKSSPVILEKHVIIGAGSVILPGVTLGIGSAVGALSLVNKNCEAFGIYVGNPAVFLRNRNTNLLELERRFENEENE